LTQWTNAEATVKIQFILKKNETYGFVTYHRRSSGLWNSTRFIVESLVANGVDAEIVEVNDNNDIDREVTRFNPDLCIIEALWVVPEKFDVLMKLHPKTRWFVHMHSGMPFLALEGISMDWIIRYAKSGVGIIANSQETFEDFKVIVPESLLSFLPNVYISLPQKATPVADKGWIDVACFGAIRPMKNHLLQALAAIAFARGKKKALRFHVNGSRVEVGGSPVLKCLEQLFALQTDAELVICDWMEPVDLIPYLQTMDLGMQVSMTETFNVVCADYVTAGIPVVASKEVAWLSNWCVALDNSITDIVRIMNRVYGNSWIVSWNQYLLKRNSAQAQQMWLDWCKRNT
jgi:hypothetical protein